MKKLVLLFMNLVVCCNLAFSQKNEKAIGINLGYGSGSYHKSFKVGAEFKYNITDAIRIAPGFDYFLKSDGIGLWSANVNGHYLFNIKSVEGLKVYPLFGFTLLGSIGDGVVDMSDIDYSDLPGYDEYIDEEVNGGGNATKFGCNLGAGIQYSILDNIDLGFELKYQFVKDFDQFVLGINAAYKF